MATCVLKRYDTRCLERWVTAVRSHSIDRNRSSRHNSSARVRTGKVHILINSPASISARSSSRPRHTRRSRRRLAQVPRDSISDTSSGCYKLRWVECPSWMSPYVADSQLDLTCIMSIWRHVHMTSNTSCIHCRSSDSQRPGDLRRLRRRRRIVSICKAVNPMTAELGMMECTIDLQLITWFNVSACVRAWVCRMLQYTNVIGLGKRIRATVTGWPS